MSLPAVFLDRDGVINVDVGYLYRPEDFRFIKGSAEALRIIRQKGWKLVVVTNQSGIARGMYTEQQYLLLDKYMRDRLSEMGVPLDGSYYCPHHPDFGSEKYRKVCSCRKPNPGMLLEAARDLDIDLARSYMVGDRKSDLLAGRNAGVEKTVLVRTGEPVTEEAASEADYVLNNLRELADLIPQVQENRN